MKGLSFEKSEAPVIVQEGTVLFAQGENSKYLYLVKRGKVVLLKNNGPHLVIIKVCGEKEILNEVSVLTSKPNEFAAIAKTETELVLVEQKDILSVIKHSPEWVPEIFNTLCERLKATEEIIVEHNLGAGEKGADLILSKDDEKKYINALAEHKAQ
jgi:CRP-like cAMP-binding protein